MLDDKDQTVTADLDYVLDFAGLRNGRAGAVEDYLVTGETIVSYTVTASDDALTIHNDAITDSGSSITLWLSGGVVGTWYSVVTHIVTSATPPREDDRTFRILIKSNS